ncbi:hypothetical protein CVT24_012981 [Panaeolus cyanescens]|uniref:Translation initiation factor eIF2B subunit epsilon n=1 Tax=Panaeolus cyanescens TaxID=181874 RepID=A0A409WA88_9AGAR|nr:hypothetical protein CVT24_012981 [Panaeolus cyanescens]
MAAKSASSGKEKLIDDEEEVLQAVILADSFNKRFRPLSTQKPRCLLPICNAPLLDWTFESLALAGVQEVFVICRSHAGLVKNAIKESKWSKPGSGMKIVPIMTAKETFSPGDAMRDIYTRGLVTSDFVLVMGDLVSNIRIDEVVRVHKERRKTNKDAIMTMVVKESGPSHRTRAQGESSIFVLDSETSECLHYEHVQSHPKRNNINIPREILAEHPEIDIRNDLIDCSIDVCSVEVPSLFQDNFDYLDIRRDFVHGILTSDLLMKSIHCYVAKEGYAARVQDTRSYDSVSKDILSRWTFPLVPDDNHPGGHIYEHTRGNRYISKDNTVILARTANIGTNTMIGSSTQISENVTIKASVIGQKCNIGTGTTISNSYIFENATIGANCVIERSIIGAGANIKDGSRIPKGCLIADGVVIGPNAKLEPFERLSARRASVVVAEATAEENDADEDDDSDIEEVEANQDSVDKATLGADTNAIVWPRGPPEEEEDDEEGPENYKNQLFMRLACDGTDLVVSDGDGSSSSDDESSSDESDFHDGASLSGLSEGSAALDLTDVSNLRADAEFKKEVTQSLERAFAEGHSVDNAAVELKTLRMASNVPLTRVKEAVIAAIVEKITLVEGDMASQRKEIGSVIGRWGELINRIGGVDPAHCASSPRMSLFGQILAALYQADIVEEDDIRAWHGLAESQGSDRKTGVETDNFKKCWLIGTHMIQQFDEQDSETETGSETETDSEDEDKSDAAKTPVVAPKVPAAVAAAAVAVTAGSVGDQDSSSESSESDAEETTEGHDGGVSEDVSASESSSAAPSTTASEDESESEAASSELE